MKTKKHNNKDYYKDKIAEYMTNRPADGYASYLKNKYEGYSHICVFGVGNMGLDLPSELSKYHIKVDFFCDNDPKKTGRMYCDIPCLSVDELCTYKDNTVVLIATRYYKEIYQQLQKLGFVHLDRILDNKFAVDRYLQKENPAEIIDKLQQVIEHTEDEESAVVLTRIVQEWCRNEYEYGQLDDICSTNQYFDDSVIKLQKKEIFVDCGAYIGDTLDEFLAITDNQFVKAYLFELSSKNYELLVNKISQLQTQVNGRIQTINSGVAKTTDKIRYQESNEGSGISKDGNTIGHVVSMDDFFRDNEVTYIKMDIEGAEKEALEGAGKLIHRCHPKLAICLYHKPQDLWELPLLMKQLCPNYRLYIRHYTDLMNETVCYAIEESGIKK